MNPALALYLTMVAVGAYWLPSFIAIGRRIPGRAQVAIINVWAVLGFPWVIALVRALKPLPQNTPFPPSWPAYPALRDVREGQLDPRD